MIGTHDYRVAAETISECYDLGLEAVNSLIGMASTLSGSDINPRERGRSELFNYIRATYSLLFDRHIANQTALLGAIRALNDHVLREYGHDEIDDFLADNYLEVPLTFAVLSDLAGYTVTEIGDAQGRFRDIDVEFKNVDLTFSKIGWSNV